MSGAAQAASLHLFSTLLALGCCRCGRRHGAVGRELIEGKIGSVAAAHFPSSLPFPFTPSHTRVKIKV